MKFSHEHSREEIAMNCALNKPLLSNFRPKSAETSQEFAVTNAMDALAEPHC
jgi:hypothetical protein